MIATRKVVGIVGSYRKHGYIDTAITEILTAAETQGAQCEKIYLVDRPIEFCTNCRVCLQEPGLTRGQCVLNDDMESILQTIDSADALAIGAPVNFGNINALTKRFLERCVCYGYWPKDAAIPAQRNPVCRKKAVLVASSAAPAWMGRWFTGTLGSLKDLAKMLGAKPIGVLWMGLTQATEVKLCDKIKRQARQLGQKLAL